MRRLVITVGVVAALLMILFLCFRGSDNEEIGATTSETENQIMTPSEESGNAASSSIPTQSESVETSESTAFDSQILEDWIEEENTSSETTSAKAENEENTGSSTTVQEEEVTAATTQTTSATEERADNSEPPSESSQPEEETTQETENGATDETQESSEDHGIVLPDVEL